MAYRTRIAVALCLLALSAAHYGCAPTSVRVEEDPADGESRNVEQATSDEDALTYPKRVTVDETSVIIHAPQIRSWEDFEVMQGIAAWVCNRPISNVMMDAELQTITRSFLVGFLESDGCHLRKALR